MNPILGAKISTNQSKPNEKASVSPLDKEASSEDSAQFMGMLLGMGQNPGQVPAQALPADKGQASDAGKESTKLAVSPGDPSILKGAKEVVDNGSAKGKIPLLGAGQLLAKDFNFDAASLEAPPPKDLLEPPPQMEAQALLLNPELREQRLPVAKNESSANLKTLNDKAPKILDQPFLAKGTKGESEQDLSLQSILSLLTALPENSEAKLNEQDSSESSSESTSSNPSASRGQRRAKNPGLFSHDFIAAKIVSKDATTSADDGSSSKFKFDSSTSREMPNELLLNAPALKPAAGFAKSNALATAAAQSPAPGLALQTASGMLELQRSITEMTKAGKEEISIHLAPKHLGDLHIRVKMTDDNLSVKFGVDTAEAKALLEKDLGSLKQRLETSMPVSQKGEMRSVEIALQQNNVNKLNLDSQVSHDRMRQSTSNVVHSEDFLNQSRSAGQSEQGASQSGSDSQNREGFARQQQGQARQFDQKERNPSRGYDVWEKAMHERAFA